MLPAGKLHCLPHPLSFGHLLLHFQSKMEKENELLKFAVKKQRGNVDRMGEGTCAN